MKLLLDIGNTRLKWACTSDDFVSQINYLYHQQVDLEASLLTAWHKLAKPTMLAISCVSNAALVDKITKLAQQLWPDVPIYQARSVRHCLGVTNGYEQAEKLGIDRWLALIAARQMSRQPTWVIDCGTAITLDFISAAGVHLGGLISPGLALMRQALASGTAQLGLSSEKFPLGLADHTQAAIYSGSLYAAIGLIEKTIRTENQNNSKILLTGGDAELIAAELVLNVEVQTDLVLRGLLAIAQQINY